MTSWYNRSSVQLVENNMGRKPVMRKNVQSNLTDFDFDPLRVKYYLPGQACFVHCIGN